MILYTFRTFPYLTDMPQQFGAVFIFAQLKNDMEKFKTILKADQDHVIGIALTKGQTRQEPVAINRFNSGKIHAGGAISLELTTLPHIKVAAQPTHSFCNWTMYTIQKYINDNELSNKFTFIHIKKTTYIYYVI